MITTDKVCDAGLDEAVLDVSVGVEGADDVGVPGVDESGVLAALVVGTTGALELTVGVWWALVHADRTPTSAAPITNEFTVTLGI